MKKYEKFIFEKSMELSDDVILLLIVILIWFYIDNNFHSELDNLFKQLVSIDNINFESKKSVFENLDQIRTKVWLLKTKYRGTDKYCFIAKSVEWFFHYYFLVKKQHLLKEWKILEVERISRNRVMLAISELDYILNYNEDDYYFYYLNTLISYINYDLLFVNNEILKKEYYAAIQKHIDKLSLEKIKKFSKLSKVVFLNNILFLRDHLTNITQYYSLIDLVSDEWINWLAWFTNFYSGVDTNLSRGDIIKHTSNNVSLYYFFSGQDKLTDNLSFINRISALEALMESCPIKTIRRNAELLFKFYTQKYKNLFVNLEVDIRKNVEKYKTDLFFNLYNTVERSYGFDQKLIENVLKSFIIQYLWLDVNNPNLKFTIYVSDDVHKYLDISFIKPLSEYNDRKIKSSIDLGYLASGWVGKFLLSIQVPSSIKIQDISSLDSNSALHFFKLILNKLAELNIFLSQVEKRFLELQNKDKETAEHMEKVGLITELLIKNCKIKKYKKWLSKLKSVFPVKEDMFYKIVFWILHDIGKYNNVDIMNIHKNSNTRIEWYEIFSQFLSKVLPFWVKNVKENRKNNLKVWDIHHIVRTDKKFQDTVKELFDEISTFNLKNSMQENYYTDELLRITNNLYLTVKENLEENNINYYVIKEPYLEKIAKNIKTVYGLDIDKNNVDVFFLTLILVLLELGKLQVKVLTYPHILYGLQFFQIYPKFSFLSSSIYHHEYPSQEEILKYDWDKGLEMFNKILWIDLKYIDKWDRSPIEYKNKNFVMVLTTIADLINALLWKRSYQAGAQIEERIIPYLNEDFLWELTDVMVSENFSNEADDTEVIVRLKKQKMEIVLSKLSRDFKDNEVWKDFENIVKDLEKRLILLHI